MVVTNDILNYHLKVTRHLGHFLKLTTTSGSLCKLDLPVKIPPIGGMAKCHPGPGLL